MKVEKMKPCEGCKTAEACIAKGACAMKKSDDEETAPGLLGRLMKVLGKGSGTVTIQITEPIVKKDPKEMTPEELRDEVIKSRTATPEKVEESPVAKAAVEQAEQLTKRLNDAEERIKKMQEAEADRATVRLAKNLVGDLPIEVDDVKTILKSCTSPEATAALENIFKKFEGILEESNLFEPVGKSGGDEDGDDAEVSLEKRAVELQKAEGVDYATAYAMALEENPDAYEASLSNVEN